MFAGVHDQDQSSQKLVKCAFLSKTSAMIHIWHAFGICTMKEKQRIYTGI
jgi:hypothetical protein